MLDHEQFARKVSSKNLAWKFSLQVEEMDDLVVTKHHRINSKPGDKSKIQEIADMTPRHKHGDGNGSMANGCSNGDRIPSGHRESAMPCVDADGITRQGSMFDKVSDKTDGLQELLQLAQEFESEETSQGGSDKKSHSHSCNEGLNEGFPPEAKVELVKEDIDSYKGGMEAACSEEARVTGGVPEEEVSASCSLSEAKFDPNGDQRSLENKEDFDFGPVAHGSVKKIRSKSASVASITVGPSRSQFTIPQPFSLATDKRASGGGRPRDAENGPLQKALGSNGSFNDTCLRTPEISKVGSKLHVERSLRPEIIKHQPDTLKKLSIRESPQQRDEDTMSISSIMSCSLAPKAKASRFTSTSSFKFQSDVRAERRKEYYAKLQERLTAKEEEMNQMLAKAKKEREEEIKLLRKNLTFKAHPVPSFYQEGPPQKADLPKTPATRAKSPNFSRRESNFGGSTRLCTISKCEANHRSSFSPQKPGKGSNIELLAGANYRKKSLEGIYSAKSPEKKVAEANPPSCDSASELLDVEFSNADIRVKVRDPLIVSSDLMSDEEEEVDLAQLTESKHANSDGGNEVYHDEVSPIKCNETSAVIDYCERLDWQVRASNVLQGQVNANAGICNKTMAGKKAQPLVHEDSKDLPSKGGSQITKKQRYKALTPTFRKHESRRDEGHAPAKKEVPRV